MARLFTVRVSFEYVPNLSQPVFINGLYAWRMQRIYECDFAGIHFSRENEADMKEWVRKAAKNVYGHDTQVIFLHTER